MSEAGRSDALALFGITSDLAFKQISLALHALARHECLSVPVIGVAGAEWNLERLRPHARTSFEAHGAVDKTAFAALLRYVEGDYHDGLAAQQDQPRALAGILDQLARRVHRTLHRAHEIVVMSSTQIGLIAARHDGSCGLATGLLPVGAACAPIPAENEGRCHASNARNPSERTPARLGRQSGSARPRPGRSR